MDQGNHGLGIDTTTGWPHRRDFSHHGCHSFWIPGDWRSGRVFSRLERRCGDGDRSEFRDRRKRDCATEALQGETAVGTDTEEYRHIHRLYPCAGAYAFPAHGNRSESRTLVDDDRLHSYRRRHPDFALSNSAASIPLQVTAEDILNPF